MSSTRRSFLSSTVGGSLLTWGGLRISPAHQTSSALTSNFDATVQRPDQFIYGSAFFRPPNPPPEQRREMLRAIAEDYHFNIIRIYLAWVYCNPKPDQFDFTELEEVMRYCDEFGIRVLVGVITEEAPYWLEQAHPETRFVDAKGRAQRLSDSGNNVSGGWPGLCLDWQPVREAATRFIQEMIKVVARHPSMYAYDCWNEPHIEPAWKRNIWATPQDLLFCYCDRTIADFQDWLRARYGTLENLNRAWVRRYPDWRAIDPPRAMGTYLDWVDWRGFIIERSTREMSFRVNAVRSADTEHVIESHAGMVVPVEPMAVSGVNPWRLAEVVQTWGLSLFPRWFTYPASFGAARVDITRSCAAGKEFWMTELQGGHGSGGLWRSPKMRARDIRFWNWIAVIGGAKGLLYWTYHSEATGSEATGFGLVDRAGRPTERVHEAADDNRHIQQHWDLIKNYHPAPKVAILFDQDNALLTYAMAGQEDASTESFRGYAHALWNLDLMADYIEPQGLNENGYKVIIVPWHLMGKQTTCNSLRNFVEKGGTLVLETGFGLFDAQTFYNPVVPPYGLADVFGYREGESFYIYGPGERRDAPPSGNLPEEERIYFDGELEFTQPVGVKVRAHTFLTPLEITSATAIATGSGFPVAAAKKVGAGKVYYIGTNLGASILAGDANGIQLLREIITPVVQPAITSEKVRPRLIEGEKNSLLVVFNDTAEDQSAVIQLQKPYRQATELYGGEGSLTGGNILNVKVPYQSVSVVRLD
jgi:beta-galactosidase GanA